MEIGNSIKTIRKRKKIPQGKLAEMVGISQTAMSQIENGHTYPQQSTLNSICEALEVKYLLLLIMTISRDDVKDENLHLYDAFYPEIESMLFKIFN